MIVKDVLLFGSRLTLGSYLAAHGAQKLWGGFGGPGLDKAAAGFETMGLRPGRAMAVLASTSEVAGGALTATGLAYPLGPITIGAAMATASTAHRKHGPFSAKGGFELPLTNLAAAAALAAAGPGRLSLDALLRFRLRWWVTAAAVVSASTMSAYCANQVLSRSREMDLTDKVAPERERVGAGA